MRSKTPGLSPVIDQDKLIVDTARIVYERSGTKPNRLRAQPAVIDKILAEVHLRIFEADGQRKLITAWGGLVLVGDPTCPPDTIYVDRVEGENADN